MPTRRFKLLAVSSFPNDAAATRYRCSALSPYLATQGIDMHQSPFFDDDALRTLYDSRYRAKSVLATIRGIAKRLREVIGLGRYDGVFVQREAAILGPAFFEHIASRHKHIALIFDFDDAIWLTDTSRSTYPRLAKLFKQPEKVLGVMRHADLVIGGSRYLVQQADAHNATTLLARTVVSRDAYTPLPCRSSGEPACDMPVVGWVGSHSTAFQLIEITNALKLVREKGYQFDLRIVGANPDFNLAGLDATFVPWSLEREAAEFANIDVGLAPMSDTPWSKGKCGFKQIQYMAAGVPFVSSSTGGAAEFIENGAVGLVANSQTQWVDAIERLLKDRELRSRLSQAGRTRVEQELCIELVGPKVAQAIAATIMTKTQSH